MRSKSGSLEGWQPTQMSDITVWIVFNFDRACYYRGGWLFRNTIHLGEAKVFLRESEALEAAKKRGVGWYVVSTQAIRQTCDLFSRVLPDSVKLPPSIREVYGAYRHGGASPNSTLKISAPPPRPFREGDVRGAKKAFPPGNE